MAGLTPGAEGKGGSVLDALEHELAAGSARRAADAGIKVMESADSAARAAVALVTGRALLMAGSDAQGIALLGREAARAATEDAGAAALMLAHSATARLRVGAVSEALALAEQAALTAPTSSRRVGVLCDATLGATLVAGSQRGRGRALAPGVDDLLDVVDPVRDGRLVVSTGGMALIWMEDYEAAARLLDGLEVEVRRAGATGVLSAVLAARALLEHRQCLYAMSERTAAEAADLAEASEQATIQPLVASIMSTVEAILGRAGSCRNRALALLDSPVGSSTTVRTAALSALGLLELGEGRPQAAVHWFEVLAASAPATDRPSPGVMMWEADLVEAYVALGQKEQARRTLERLEARAAQSGNPRAAAASVRCRAALADNDEEAERLYDKALESYQTSDRHLARGRTEMARAQRRMRSGRREEARQGLLKARQEFDQIGAAGWSRRASSLLADLGPEEMGPSPNRLTPEEAQVAMAASLGSDVTTIASGLFVSEETVSARLASAQVKLRAEDSEPAARAQMLDCLGQDAGALPPTASPAGVNIRLLGGFSIQLGGQTVAAGDGITAHAIKVVALAGKVRAEALIEELWPEAEPELGRARLRSLLGRLRRQVGPLLERRESWIVLADKVTVDVDEFERLAGEVQASVGVQGDRAGELAERAVDFYAGELLPADRHLEFTTGPRERLRRRYLAVVDVATDHACRLRLLETAVRRLEDAVAVDPYDEHLYFKAATILADAGRPSESLSVIRRAESALAELGLPLSSATRELQTRLRQGAWAERRPEKP